MDAYTGEIRAFAGTYAPHNWALCNGQTLAIQSNTALFSIIGINFGGNGTTTFMLPNIQSQVINGMGQLPGGQMYNVGDSGGENSVTLITSEMPVHTHVFNGATVAGTAGDVTVPTNNTYVTNFASKVTPTSVGVLGRVCGPSTPGSNTNLNPFAVGITGGSTAHENRMPFVTINYCICLYGNYPARN